MADDAIETIDLDGSSVDIRVIEGLSIIIEASTDRNLAGVHLRLSVNDAIRMRDALHEAIFIVSHVTKTNLK